MVQVAAKPGRRGHQDVLTLPIRHAAVSTTCYLVALVQHRGFYWPRDVQEQVSLEGPVNMWMLGIRGWLRQDASMGAKD